MRWLCVLVALAGCQLALGIKDFDRGFDRCAAQPFEPLRYALATNHGYKTTYADATTMCLDRGMEAISFDDAAEHAMFASTIAAWTKAQDVAPDGRIYTGLTDAQTEGTWTNVDGCPVSDIFWDGGEPNGGTNENCAVIDPGGGLEDVTCAGDVGGTYAVVAIACETPRWTTSACLAASKFPPDPSTLVFDPTPVAHDAAVNRCASAGGHLVEIDSTAERDAANGMALGATYWLGGQNTGGVWVSATGCPQIFPWRDGEPMVGNGNCVVGSAGGAYVVACAESHATICEPN